MPQATKNTNFFQVGNMRIYDCPSYDCEIERTAGTVDRMHIETEGDTFWIRTGRQDYTTVQEHETYRKFIEMNTDLNYLYN